MRERHVVKIPEGYDLKKIVKPLLLELWMSDRYNPVTRRVEDLPVIHFLDGNETAKKKSKKSIPDK
jgi:hypothetical protein